MCDITGKDKCICTLLFLKESLHLEISTNHFNVLIRVAENPDYGLFMNANVRLSLRL